MSALRRRNVLQGLGVIAAGLGFLATAAVTAGAEELTLKSALFVPPSTTYGIGVPFHFYVTKDMTVTKPKDLKGLRFRGQPNYAAMFRHYGIAGVNIAPPEVYTALERGTVQGYGWPLWGIEDFGWDKLTKIRIDPGFYNVTVNVLMNKPKYDSLSAEQRKVLDDAVVWFEQDDLRYTAQKSKDTL